MTTENKPHDLTPECLDAHAQQSRDAVYAMNCKSPDWLTVLTELEAFAYARGRWEGFGSAPAEAKLRAAIAAIVRRAG